MKSPTLKTENYLIKPFDKDDSLLWQEWDIDSDVQKYMPEPKNEPEDILEQYKYIEECEEGEEGYYWSVESNTGNTIGTVGLFEIDQYHKTAEVGIVIGDKEFWGKGVATEIMKEIVNFGFVNLNIEYISAEIEEGNIGMQKVFIKCGFVQDGLFKGARVKEGKRVDVLHFSISK